MLLSLLALLPSVTSRTEPAAEFFVRTDRKVPVERLAKDVVPIGKIDSRMPGSSIFLIQLRSGVEAKDAKERLAHLPGVHLLDADEEPVNTNSVRSLDRKIAHLLQAEGDEADKKRAADKVSGESKDNVKGKKKGESDEDEKVDYLRALRYFISRRAYPNDSFDWKSIERGREHAARMKTAPLASLMGPHPMTSNNWAFIGPTNLQVPYNQYYGISPCNGRVNAVAFDPNNSQTFYAGGAQGGLWKTTNSGNTWSWISSSWTQLGVNCIVIDPNDSNTIYVGRGDYHGYILGSYGIMKSTDGGNTWNEIAEASMGQVGVNRVLIDPTNSQTLIAGTGDSSTFSGFIYRSTNGGQTWSQVAVGGQYFIWPSLAAGVPSSGSVRFYAVAGGYATSTGASSRVYKSDDHGVTWQLLASPVPADGVYHYAYEVATSPTNPNNVYVLDSENQGLYTSANQGESWQNQSGNLPTGNDVGNDYNFSQGWYDYHLECGNWVQGTTNSDVLFLGEIDLTESLDGGNTWISIGGPSYDPNGNSIAHNDQHCLAVCPSNPNLAVFSNDGGVYSASFDSNYNPTVTNLNTYLGNTMFYHIAMHPTNQDIMVGGAQDNATPVSYGDLGNWTNVAGGDGGGVGVNQTNPLIQYASIYDLSIFNTNDGWNTENYIGGWGSPFSGNAPFVCTITMDPENQYLMYTGSNFLYQWNESSQVWNGPLGNRDLSSGNGGTLQGIAVAPTNSNVIYTGSSDGALFMTANQGGSWTQLTASNLPGQGITSVNVSPANPYDILVGFGSAGQGIAHLYRCANTQASSPTFTSVSGGGAASLPDVSLNAITRDIASPTTTWYVGMDVGVFETTNSGATWTNAGAALGLPNVIVDDLVSVPGTGFLNAGTYGRGAWRIEIGGVTNTNLSGFSLSPTTIPAGGTSIGTLKLTIPAPASGAIVDLNSSNPNVATTPTVVTVPAGATSTTFSVTGSSTLTAPATATITATYNNVTLSQALTVSAITVGSVTLSPSTVVGGANSTGTVTLTAQALPGGFTVGLASNSSAAAVPDTVRVAAGSTSATFPITTSVVPSNTTATITAALNGAQQTAKLSIDPAVVKAVSVSPSSVTGGTPASGTVTLTGPAATGGSQVTLASNNTDATVPSSVTVAAGSTTATFTVSTKSVSTTTTASITATTGTISQSTTLTLNPPAVSGITISPASVVGGAGATGTVTLSGAAGSSGAVVNLSSGNPCATVPGSVTVASGATTATFKISTTAVSVVTTALISASTGGGGVQTGTLTVSSATVGAISLAPSAVVGGSTSTGTVTLTGPAAQGGASVALSSTSGAATVPQTVTVAAGASSASFTITTLPVATTLTASISASLNGGSAGAYLTVEMPLLAGISVSPSTVVGGNNVVGTVLLTRGAPAGGAVVSLSATTGAGVPSSVAVAAGASSATFTIQTSGVATTVTLSVSATLSGTSESASLTLTPASLAGLTIIPNPVGGGSTATGNVSLTGAAPPSGISVTLASSSTDASVPSSLTIPAGALSGRVGITTKPVSSNVTATISATATGLTVKTALTIQPASLAGISLSPTSVVGGSKATVAGTVTLSGMAASAGATIKLTSSDVAAASVPASVKVASGSSTATFAVTHKAVTATTKVTITASYSGVTQTATLSLTPFTIVTLGILPTSVAGGGSATGTVVLNAEPGTSGAIAVKLASSVAAAVVPAIVSVPVGSVSGTFKITTKSVLSVTTAGVTATIASSSGKATLTITPPSLLSLSVLPIKVKGSATTAVTGTVTISGPAPTGGLVVTLGSSNTAAATVPASMTIAAGQTKGTFKVSHSKVAAQVTVTLKASLAGQSVTTTLTVTP